MRILIDADRFFKAVRSLEEDIKTNVSKLSGIVKEEIAVRTPIKTGRARRGWQDRQNQVENRVPYIGRLEEGYSKQARNGFVKQGISAAVKKFNKGENK